jgi:hypothetical protein
MENKPESPAPIQQLVGRLRELASKATPAPWIGDRFDGTVKYFILGGSSRVNVCRGDNGNSECGPYGFENSADEELVMAMRNALPALLEIAEAANLALDHMDGNDVPAWLSESYLALGAALRLPPNANITRPGEPSQEKHQ